ncbi:hypothetical protein COOONC_12965, partial [Cooperia oncophora]
MLPPRADFGLAAVNLIAKKEWNNELPVCVRKDGRCVPQQYPPAGNSIVAEAEAGQGTIEVTGVVPARGHYMFLVHYFNPDNTPLNIGVLLQNDHYFEATVPLAYCPSIIQFWMEDKYTATLYHNNTQKGPIFI